MLIDVCEELEKPPPLLSRVKAGIYCFLHPIFIRCRNLLTQDNYSIFLRPLQRLILLSLSKGAPQF